MVSHPSPPPLSPVRSTSEREQVDVDEILSPNKIIISLLRGVFVVYLFSF